jgi:polyferredoxin
MRADTTTNKDVGGKKSLWVRRRNWIIILGILLFLPPLAIIFQVTQDSNFCGTWCPRMFFSWRKGTDLGQFLLGFVRSYMGVALVAGVLLSTLFLGRYWCSHLCPVGGSMEAGGRLLPRFLKINFSGIPAPSFRYGYLLVYLLVPAIGLGSLCCNYCNFATVPRAFGSVFLEADMAYFFRTAGLINLGLVIFLGFLARGGRAYCNLLCPIGALDALSNRFGRKFGKRVNIDSEKCNGCGSCDKVCPTWAIEVKDTASIDQLSCMPCRLCEESCPVEAISYGKHKE